MLGGLQAVFCFLKVMEAVRPSASEYSGFMLFGSDSLPVMTITLSWNTGHLPFLLKPLSLRRIGKAITPDIEKTPADRREFRFCTLAADDIQHFTDILHGLGQGLHDLHILNASKLSVLFSITGCRCRRTARRYSA